MLAALGTGREPCDYRKPCLQCRHPLLRELIEATLKQPGKITVFCFAKRRAKRKRVSGQEDIALVYKTTGSSSAGDRRSLSGVALVSVMESSKLRNRDDAPTFWLLDDS
jgi:hypothetical protein